MATKKITDKKLETEKELKKDSKAKKEAPAKEKAKKEPELVEELEDDEDVKDLQDELVKVDPFTPISEPEEEEHKTVKANIPLPDKNSKVKIQVPEDDGQRTYKPKAKSFSRRHKKSMITLDGDINKYKKELSPVEKTKIELVSSYKTGNPLVGEMFGHKKEVINGVTYYVALVKYGSYLIQIPAHYFHEINEAQKSLEGAYISGRVGSKVSFVPVTNANDIVETVAIGNRNVAMENLRKMWWFGKLKGDDEYRYREGIISEANVTAVAGKFIIVEMFGVETRIPLSELSYNYVENAKNMFKPGDVVMVRIKKIVRNEKNKTVEVVASVKEAKPNPRKEAFYMYQVGASYRGQITGWHTSQSKNTGVLGKNTGGIYVSLSDEIDCLCPFPDNANELQLGIGKWVHLKITKSKEEKLQLDGRIYHVEP